MILTVVIYIGRIIFFASNNWQYFYIFRFLLDIELLSFFRMIAYD